MSDEATIPDASQLQTTEQDLLDSIDYLQGANSDALMIPMTTLNEAITAIVDKNSGIIAKMQGKLLRKIDHASTKQLDALDGVYTRLLQGLDAYQFDAHHLLEQLAVKGGFTQVGQPLETALLKEVTEAPQLAYAGTLVLAVKEAVPYLEQLIEVLREIRDRMPPLSIRVKGETPPASEQDEPKADDQAEPEQLDQDEPTEWLDEPPEAAQSEE